MKTLSVFLSFALLVLAQVLSLWLHPAGHLPASSSAATPAIKLPTPVGIVTFSNYLVRLQFETAPDETPQS